MYIQACSICIQCSMVVWENDQCVSWAIALQQISSATLNHTKNVSNNVSVIQYAERPHITWSFQVMCLSALYTQKIASRKETVMRVWRHNSPLIYISHPALTQKIDISDSRAAIWYVEHPHTTCNFRVASVSMHKMSHRKVVTFCVWIHNSPILTRIQL